MMCNESPRRGMMKTCALAMSISGAATCAVLLAPFPAMSAEFTAQILDPNSKSAKLFVKGDSYRLEGESSSGRQLIVISNLAQKLITILDVSKKEYTFVRVSHLTSGMLEIPFELARSYRELAGDTTTPYRIRSEGADTVAGRPCEKLLVYFDAGSGQQHDLLRQCFSSELGFPLRIVVPPSQFETIKECNVELANIQEESVEEGLFSPPAEFKNALTAGPTGQSPASRVPAVPSPPPRALRGGAGQIEDHAPEFAKIPPEVFGIMMYTTEKYSACYKCHEAGLIEEESTDKTGFRDGTRNLHRHHVLRKKGLSCRACHGPEGEVNQEALMRASVPFGTRALPIKYIRLSDGGRCIVGCHREQEYHRR